MRNKFTKVLFLFGIIAMGFYKPAVAAETPRVVVTVLYASQEGSDFNLDNDAYRDRLIQLFSYSYYEQKDLFPLDLVTGEPQKHALPGGYELALGLTDQAADKLTLQGIIQKDGVIYVDTVLAISKPGVVFVGGPPLEGGVLILVLESGL